MKEKNKPIVGEKPTSRFKLFASKKEKDAAKPIADVIVQESMGNDVNKPAKRGISLPWKKKGAAPPAATSSNPTAESQASVIDQQNGETEAALLITSGGETSREAVPRGTTPTVDQQSLLTDQPTIDLSNRLLTSTSKRALTSQQHDSATNAVQCCSIKPSFLGRSSTITSPTMTSSAFSPSQTKDYITEKATGRRYIRGKLLGKGGFAKCYEFTDERTHQKYAGKIIAKARFLKTHQKEKYMQIMREIDLHRSLQHPNVVAFYSYFEDNDNMNIVLELCSRRSLVEMLRVRKMLTEPEVRYFMRQMVEGCRYIHACQIIHRDFKLGNMLLSDIMELKIADFGLATQVLYEGEKKITVCGTPNYIAPEVLGKRGHSFEVDIWAMGCILYALLVGAPPFETTSLKETYARIMSNRYYIPAHVAMAARTLIRKLLSGEPSKRPTCDQIINDDFFRTGFMPHSLPPQCCEQVPKFTSHQNQLEITASSVSTLDPMPQRRPGLRIGEGLITTLRGGNDEAALLDTKMDKIEMNSAEILDMKASPVKKRSSKEIKDKKSLRPSGNYDSDDSESASDDVREESNEWDVRRLPASVQKQEDAKAAQQGDKDLVAAEMKGVTRSTSVTTALPPGDTGSLKRDEKLAEKLIGRKIALPFTREKSKSLNMKKAKEVSNRIQDLQTQFLNERMRTLADEAKRGSTLGQSREPAVEESFHTDVMTKLSTLARATSPPPATIQEDWSNLAAEMAMLQPVEKQLFPQHLEENPASHASMKQVTKNANYLVQLPAVTTSRRSSISGSGEEVTPPPNIKSSKRFSSERWKSGERRDVRKEIESRKLSTKKLVPLPEPAVVQNVPEVFVPTAEIRSPTENHLMEYDKSLARNVSERSSGRRRKPSEKSEESGKKLEDVSKKLNREDSRNKADNSVQMMDNFGKSRKKSEDGQKLNDSGVKSDNDVGKTLKEEIKTNDSFNKKLLSNARKSSDVSKSLQEIVTKAEDVSKKQDDGANVVQPPVVPAPTAPARKPSQRKPANKAPLNSSLREASPGSDENRAPPPLPPPLRVSTQDLPTSSGSQQPSPARDTDKPNPPRPSRSRQQEDIPRIRLTTIDRSPQRRQGQGNKQKDGPMRALPPEPSSTPVVPPRDAHHPPHPPAAAHLPTPVVPSRDAHHPPHHPAAAALSPPVLAGGPPSKPVSRAPSNASSTGYVPGLQATPGARNAATLPSQPGQQVDYPTPTPTRVGRKPSTKAATLQAQGPRTQLAPPPAEHGNVSKLLSDSSVVTSMSSGLDRPASYAMPSGPEDELHKITASLAQWQASQKPTQVVEPLHGEFLMEEGSALWEGEGFTSLGALETSEVISGSALTLYQMLKLLTDSPVPSRNNPPPIHDISPLYVAKWVDYSNKYGFGFQLSDGSVGVLFNDKTRMIFAVSSSHRVVHHCDATNHVVSFAWDAVPEPFQAKSALLFQYAQYMDTHLMAGAAGASSSLGRTPPSASPVFLKKWFRANKAIVLYLTNGTLQVNFLHDHTKVIISSVSTEYCVTFINSKRVAVTYNLRNLATFGCRREMTERLIYARRMMENVMNFEGVAV